ncbi:MAG: ATP-dependent helicase, partial [Ignavibacteria bacterium]|nr:ATP-dependent helicase [Ignavibacteria bacterium]
LNDEQRKAVEFVGTQQIVLAGAGSGKTKVTNYKVAFLIKKGLKPDSILALTYTNKAAGEIRAKVKELVGKKADSISIGTFQSIFANILRTEAKHINYRDNFSIYDVEDSLSLVSNVMEALGIEVDGLTSNTVRHRISYLKNHMINPVEYRKKIAKTKKDKLIADIFEEYQNRLVANNSMDFEELLLETIKLFSSKKQVLQKYKKKFKYIIVDEFQDTNKTQYKILKLLVSRSCKVTVVGDDSQGIFGWKGANLKNMHAFKKDFKNHKLFKLEQNFRSTKTILTAADSVIKNNKDQYVKTLYTQNNDGEQLTLIKCADEKDEAFQLAKYIKKEISKKKLSYKDFAILYRTNAQSRALEDIFRKEKVPHTLIGGLEFYRRKEVKDVIAYLRVIANTNDEESLLRIMNFPQRGIGNTTVTRMIAFARKHEITLFQTMSRVFEVIDIKERIQKNVKGFRLLLEKYIELKDKLSLGELSRALVDELGLIRMFKSEHTAEANQRIQNINRLLQIITEYSDANKGATLDEFLEEVSLTSGIDMYDEEKNAVTLLTLHSAKGMEFPIVFISGCEEEIFPLANKFSEDTSVEEERRLFYVGMTRAEQKVFISHARSRYRFGEVAYQSRSRFIDEIKPAALEEVNGGIGRKANRKTKKELFYEYFNSVDYDDFDQDNKVVHIGSRVMHEKFGLGKVVDVTGVGDQVKATVNFEGNNVRQLMLKFARLKILH